jgi:hypothetical protein
MKNLIKTEELAVFAATIFLLYQFQLHVSWWLYIILFFSPDIGMLGYLINTKAGAFTYNLFHHKAIAVMVIASGYFFKNDVAELYGMIMLAHSSFDRVLGYGLKYQDNFKHTSLGYL